MPIEVTITLEAPPGVVFDAKDMDAESIYIEWRGPNSCASARPGEDYYQITDVMVKETE
jgi:hypothetical protein